MAIGLVWFRNDLRLGDNPALHAALRAGLLPLPVYIHAPEEEGDWRPGPASDAWRHRSLAALDADLRRRGSRLRFFVGPAARTLETLVAATGAEAVFWNRRYEPAIARRDGHVARNLRRLGLRVETFNGSLLFEPWDLHTRTGDPYRVFTPFWRAAREALHLPSGSDAPPALPDDDSAPAGEPLAALGLAPRVAWDTSFWETWAPGEAGAMSRIEEFQQRGARNYANARDRPDLHGTSRLSPHLHFGEIAPWRILRLVDGSTSGASRGVEAFARELGWREFAHHVLHHFLHTPDSNFDPRFDAFSWNDAVPAVLDAWRRGRTGVPIVDAAMRELWTTGWMHNRARMIVASFLTKNLRLHWRHGARWFWHTLVDADLANNTLGWQWVAGTGVDAAPYFRVFNPVTQARKFDPDGNYTARWVPELAGLPVALHHEPWLDPAQLASRPKGYPARPIVDLAASRAAALAAYRQLQSRRAEPPV